MDQSKAISDGRTAGGWTFESLAATAGVSSRTVLRAEQGKRIKPDSLRKICGALKIDVALLEPASDVDSPDDGREDEVAPSGVVDAHARTASLRSAISRLLPGAMLMAAMSTLAIAAGNAMFVTAAMVGTPTTEIAAEAAAVRAVARYVNALAEGVGDAKPLRGFAVELCDPGASVVDRLLWTLSPMCETRTIRVEREVDPSGASRISIGPVGSGFTAQVARRLTAAPSVRWSVGMGTGPSPLGIAWFDPIETAGGQIPRPPGHSASWLFVRIPSSNVASIAR